ncbi:MAG: molybdopterin-dependent oxidoreductase [Anaerolineales bacterium]|nr:molybdopterin-dependent oxidoreductase [Anaerolineales bacterium]MCB9128231.1 molybdopterin-dependent oxidoreductase [Ardenticatenales bacterium]
MHDPLRPHRHDPNPEPPSPDAEIALDLPDGQTRLIAVEALRAMPRTALDACYIVSTGHGTSGPFRFEGVRLQALIARWWDGPLTSVEVVSGDGFGTRVLAEELADEGPRPILLATDCDGQPLRRADGLVRLIVPSERDDALRQVKWVARIRLVNG